MKIGPIPTVVDGMFHVAMDAEAVIWLVNSIGQQSAALKERAHHIRKCREINRSVEETPETYTYDQMRAAVADAHAGETLLADVLRTIKPHSTHLATLQRALHDEREREAKKPPTPNTNAPWMR